MNIKCIIRGHDWKTLRTAYLKPKPDGALKVKLESFDEVPLSEASYWGEFKRCERCGKNTVEIT